MTIVKIYGTPEKFSQDMFEKLVNGIRKRIADVQELKINEDMVSVFFPVDRFKKGLGEEVIAFVDGLFIRPERTREVRKKVANAVIEELNLYFSKALTECFVRPFDPNDGFDGSGTYG